MSAEEPLAPTERLGRRGRIYRRLRNLPREIGYGHGPWLMSQLRQRWVIFRHPHCEISFGRGCYLGPGFSLDMPFKATFIAGDGVEFRRNFHAQLGPGAAITIGAGSRLTYDVLMQCSTRIDLGEQVMAGQASAIFDGNHRYRDTAVPMLSQGYEFNEVELCDHAVLLTKCTVVGCRIGERTVVGANSVVTEDLPAYSLAVGSPARVVDSWDPAEAD